MLKILSFGMLAGLAMTGLVPDWDDAEVSFKRAMIGLMEGMPEPNVVIHPGYDFEAGGEKMSVVRGFDACSDRTDSISGHDLFSADLSCVVITPQTNQLNLIVISKAGMRSETWQVERFRTEPLEARAFRLKRPDGSYIAQRTAL